MKLEVGHMRSCRGEVHDTVWKHLLLGACCCWLLAGLPDGWKLACCWLQPEAFSTCCRAAYTEPRLLGFVLLPLYGLWMDDISMHVLPLFLSGSKSCPTTEWPFLAQSSSPKDRIIFCFLAACCG